MIGYIVKLVYLLDFKITLTGWNLPHIGSFYMEMCTHDPNKMQNLAHDLFCLPLFSVPFRVTYEKIGMRQKGFFVLLNHYVIWPVFPIWISMAPAQG